MTPEQKAFGAVDAGCAVSSVVEHYLDTVGEKEQYQPQYGTEDRTVGGHPNFHPNRKPGPRRYARVGRGLFRYVPTGGLWAVQRIKGRIRWRNLKTVDRKSAMAMIVNDGHNGGFIVESVPEPGGAVEEILAGHRPQGHLPPSRHPRRQPTQHGDVARPARASSVTFQEMAELWKQTQAGLKATTKARIEFECRMLANHLDFSRALSEITTTDLKLVRANLRTKYKPATVNNIFCKIIRPVFSLALAEGVIAYSPAQQIKGYRVDDPDRTQPSWEQAQVIIAEVARATPKSAELLQFMLLFGVGQAELRHLCGEDVDFGARKIVFRRMKTGKAFSVPLFGHANGLMKHLRATGRIEPGVPVFQWHNPRKALESACARLKFPRYSPRSLRRTFVVHALETGVEPRVIAVWQGHADARLILSVYGKFVSSDHAKQQAAKLK